MREFEYVLKDNGQYLEIFKSELVSSGTKERAIMGHIDNVLLYINDYLFDREQISMEKGCGSTICSYLGDYFIRKGGNQNAIKKSAASIKKFYKCMMDYGYVTEEDFEELSYCIKEEMESWQLRCEAFNEGDEDWFYVGNQEEESEEIVPICVEDIVEAFFDGDPNWQQYYNLFSGEFVMVPSYIEDDDYSSQQIKLAKEVEEDKYVALPGKEEVDTYSIMLAYIDSQQDKEYKKELSEALQGRRALHNFKNVVKENGDLGNYNAFYVDNITYMMVSWCVESQIPCESKIEEIQELIQEVLREQ